MLKLLLFSFITGSLAGHKHKMPENAPPEIRNIKHISTAKLTSLALSSVLEANSALRNQRIAATQASYSAKNGLAQAAQNAARTAQAALAGKQLLVQYIELQLEKAGRQLRAEEAQARQMEEAAETAQVAALKAQRHIGALSVALRDAQSGAAKARKAAGEAIGAAAAQFGMVEEAKTRIEQLEERLKLKLAEIEDGEFLAQKADNVAQMALSNAEEAAAAIGSDEDDEHGYASNDEKVYTVKY